MHPTEAAGFSPAENNRVRLMAALGCLVLHGLAGDVGEVLPLARALKEEGYAVECPTLEGHGLSRRALAKSTRHDWITSAEEGYKRLRMRADEIVIIGFSMGGLLAFQLAARYPVAWLFTINTPYYYWDVRQALRNLSGDFQAHFPRYVRGATRIPLASMLQFRRLLAETKRILPGITCPYAILQGQLDDTVQAVSAEHLRNAVGSRNVTVDLFPRSGHLLLHGPEADEAIALIVNKIKRSGSPKP
jgi:carboxylesterase